MSRTNMMARTITLAAGALLAMMACAQERETCLFSEPFDGPDLPAGWDSGAPVEQQDASGNGLGTFVVAWRVENAATSNAAGSLHVPNVPAANHFAVANDDASPCNCAMLDVALRSPAIDLTGHDHAVLAFRAYNDGMFGGSEGTVEASVDGNDWQVLRTVPEVPGSWQSLTADLSAFANGSVFVRFRWSDSGQWSTGFAVDDICVFAPLMVDLSVMNAYLGNPVMDAFDPSARSLGYTRLPFEQRAPLQVGVWLRNNGINALSAVQAHVAIALNGSEVFAMDTLISPTIAAQKDTLISWNTGWLAGGEGAVDVAFSLVSDAVDDVPEDNSATRSYLITSPSIGENTMAIDNDLSQASIGSSDSSFTTGCRFEMIAGSTVQGLGVRLSAGTELGTSIHTLLLDGQLNLLSSSAQYFVTQADVDLCYAGGSLFVPFDSAVVVDVAQDVVGLVRFDVGDGALFIAAGGEVPRGAALRIEASGLTITYPEQAPILRLYLSTPVTGVNEVELREEPLIAPNPATGTVQVRVPGGERVRSITVLDEQGRTVGNVNGGELDVAGWPAGVYVCRVVTATGLLFGRLVVVP